MQIDTVTSNTSDYYEEVQIEDMVQLIRNGNAIEVVYHNFEKGTPNEIILICGNKYTNDIREIKPILTTHSDSQLLIRSFSKDDIIIEWKEFFVSPENFYMQFRKENG
jgi:hypothetical protein